MRRRTRRIGVFIMILGFVLVNVSAFFHARQFTRFSETETGRSQKWDLSFTEKAKLLAFGFKNPRPEIGHEPSQAFEKVAIQGNEMLEGWLFRHPEPKGTVLLFHGYLGTKSSLVSSAEAFFSKGYSALMIDFSGHGGSEGGRTTIGFHEAEDVQAVYEYVRKTESGPVYLFGISMGAAAIMRAVEHYELEPDGLILECPFGKMYDAVAIRFKQAGVPAFPAAHLLMFWGGAQNGFWAFGHNPEKYARQIKIPSLLIYGEKDPRITLEETQAIFNNLQGPKELLVCPNSWHGGYLYRDGDLWHAAVDRLLEG